MRCRDARGRRRPGVGHHSGRRRGGGQRGRDGDPRTRWPGSPDHGERCHGRPSASVGSAPSCSTRRYSPARNGGIDMSERQTGPAVEERVDQTQESPESADRTSEPTQGETGPAKRLYRSRQDRMIAGVCGGLAQYFNVDPVVVRLIFLILLFGGPGILAYLILAIVVPERPLGQPEPAITSSFDVGHARQTVALILVAAGLLMLADNLQVYRISDIGRFWPLLLIV